MSIAVKTNPTVIKTIANHLKYGLFMSFNLVRKTIPKMINIRLSINDPIICNIVFFI